MAAIRASRNKYEAKTCLKLGAGGQVRGTRGQVGGVSRVALLFAAVTRTARSGEVRVLPKLGALPSPGGAAIVGRELVITKPKKLPWAAVPKAPRTRSPRSRWLARLTGPIAQHRSQHGQQVLTHIIVMLLATGIRAFRLGRRCLNLGSNAA